MSERKRQSEVQRLQSVIRDLHHAVRLDADRMFRRRRPHGNIRNTRENYYDRTVYAACLAQALGARQGQINTIQQKIARLRKTVHHRRQVAA